MEYEILGIPETSSINEVKRAMHSISVNSLKKIVIESLK